MNAKPSRGLLAATILMMLAIVAATTPATALMTPEPPCLHPLALAVSPPVPVDSKVDTGKIHDALQTVNNDEGDEDPTDVQCKDGLSQGGGGGRDGGYTEVMQYVSAIGPGIDNYTQGCAVGVAFMALQCVGAYAYASTDYAHFCGLEQNTPEQACYRVRGFGVGQAYLAAGHVDASNFGTSASCEWPLPVGNGGCDTPWMEDFKIARPGAAACSITHAESTAWFILATAAIAPCP